MEEADPNLVYWGIKITDWLQGVGSLIAIIAGAWAFISLFRKDKQKQEQIDSLVRMAEHTELQTGQLIAQTSHMEESNRLYRDYLQILKQEANYSTEQRKESERQKEIQARIRKNDIRPHFIVAGAPSDPSKLLLMLKNIGARAHLVDITISDSERLTIDKPQYENGDVLKEQVLEFYVRGKENVNLNDEPFELTITYTDIDNHKYYQKVKREKVKKDNKFTVSEPIEITPA